MGQEALVCITFVGFCICKSYIIVVWAKQKELTHLSCLQYDFVFQNDAIDLLQATLWTAGCIATIVIFNLTFDLEDQRPSRFYLTCGQDHDALYDDIPDLQAWAWSILVASAIDFFVIQPACVFVSSVIIACKSSTKKNVTQQRFEGVTSLGQHSQEGIVW